MPQRSQPGTPPPGPVTPRLAFQSPLPNPMASSRSPSPVGSQASAGSHGSQGTQVSPTPTTAPVVGLTAEQLQQLIASLAPSKSTPTYTKAPRVGGVSSTGVWTGYGQQDQQLKPRTAKCYRRWNFTSPDKAFAQEQRIEDACREGLKADPTNTLFSLPDEKDGKSLIHTLKSFKRMAEDLGYEAVFDIVLHDGTRVNMLTKPGLVSKPMMETWLEDLEKGVYLNSQRQPPCDLDAVNLDYSYSAVLNSCSPGVYANIYNKLSKPYQKTGPWALFEILQVVYRQSDNKVSALLKKLEALNLSKYPGENVTKYRSDAEDILDEIEMNLNPNTPVPTLRSAALKGLSEGSDEYFRGLVKRMMTEHTPGTTYTVETVKKCLVQAEDDYIKLMDCNSYPPGLKVAPVKALQAQVKDFVKTEVANALQRDPSAKSTRGNYNNRNNRRRSDNSSNTSSYSSSNDKSSDKSTDSDKPPGILKNGDDKKVGFRKQNPQGTNGLTEDENTAVTKAIAERKKSDPKFEADGAYEIKIDGKLLAIYCKKCRFWTRGNKKHTTKEHGKNKGSSAGYMARTSPPKSPPSPTPPSTDPLLSESLPPAKPRAFACYDFTGAAPTPGSFSLPVSDDQADSGAPDDDSVASCDGALLATLGNSTVPYPKGSGRQE